MNYPGPTRPGQPQPTPAHPQQPGQVPYAQPLTPQPVPTAQPIPVQPQPSQPTGYPQAGYPQPVPTVPATPQPVPVPQPARPVPIQAPVPPAAAPRPVPVATPGASRPLPVAARPLPVPVGDATTLREELDEEDQQPTIAAVRAAPPWLISMLFHMILLIVAALLVIAVQKPNVMTIEVTYAETLGEQLEDDVFQMAQEDPVDITEPVIAKDLTPVDDPLAAPPDLDITLDATSAVSQLEAPSIGMALNGREKGMKQALLAAYGGTATTEAAVLRGLQWLQRNQNTDGSWSLTGSYTGGAGSENRAAATAMALLAFQGAGHTHKTGQFKREVSRGWAALLKQQDKDGNFFQQGVNHHRLYTQAQCTIAICELYGMTKDAKYKKPAQLAIDYCLKAQSPEGGWRYTPRQDSDTSVTGWFVMALQSAQMAELEVPSPNLDNISKYLDKATPNGALYTYKPGSGSTPAMTAEGLLCRQYLGWKKMDPRLRQGVDYVHANPIDWNDQNVYYWYYATQTMHHMDGDDWNRWNRVMRQSVPEQQVKAGREKGSWDPTNDRWGSHGGRLFTTCLCIYMLEVYYRHLPIYSHRL